MKLNSYQLLIIDDCEEYLNQLKIYFAHKFKIFTATNRVEAIKLTYSIIPDIILLDLNLVVKNDGLIFLNKIKTNFLTANIPVIIISGVCDDDLIIKSFELGANDYLIKPFRLQHAALKISNLLKLIYNRNSASKSEFHKPFIESNNQYKLIIKNLNEFLRNNYKNSDLKITDIELYLGANNHVLNNVTKAKYGKTPVQYLKLFRLLKARKLIYKDVISKDLVHKHVGFKSHNYFSNCFKKEFGITPIAFMKNGY
ncbi:MAG: response regulator [Sphingobacteriia bacterium]|jgi:DNA-binding response OmpR family regulator